jgi:hypothetical protein
LPSQAKSKVGYDDVVSLHFNAQADFGSRACQLGLLGLRRSLLLRRCWRGRLRSRLLTTSTHDGPTNNGEDNDDDGLQQQSFDFATCAYLTLSLSSLDEQSAKRKGARAARQEAGALAAAPPKF